MSELNKKYDSTLDDWDDYMNAKKLKLEEQFLLEAGNVDIKENIFQGTSIFVNGYTIPTADDLRRLMMEYGGIYHHYYINGRTTYMIASNLPNVKIKQYKNSNIIILKPEWVTDSIKAKKMLNFKSYLLLSDYIKNERINFQKNVEEKSKIIICDINDVEDKTIIRKSISDISSPLNGRDNSSNDKSPESVKGRKTANDENFLEEFYNNSRLHHISTMGAIFKQYINELRSKDNIHFPARESLKTWKTNNPSVRDYCSRNSCIMHIDMDCFFVSVGLRKYPHLKSKPVVVTHARGNKTKFNNAESRKAEFSLYEKRYKEKNNDTENSKLWFSNIGETDSMAEIASCSYEARKFGIKNGMLLGQAFKLCPVLKTIPYDFEGYKEVSYALYNHIAKYTLDIEAVSCDEMFVDCSEILSYANVDVLEFAAVLRKEIKNITGCPCSTGFGSNRLLARLATKKAKPDGHYFVADENAKHFIQDFHVSDLPGVGHSIAAKLASIDVKTCRDLQMVPVSQLQQEFGMKAGLTLHRHSFGEDDRPLNFCHQRKSVSAEVNYGIRFENYIQAENFLKTLCNEVENRLKSIRSEGKSITVKLMVKTEEAPKETAKFLGHGICNYFTKTVSLLEATCDSAVIFREVMKIIQTLNIKPPDMRGIGIQMSKLENAKNLSKSTGKIDRFIIKTKKEKLGEITSDSLNKNVDNDNGSKNISTQKCANVKVFDESEYDVSFSQVDPNYLAALPENIRSEIVSDTKKKSKKKGRFTLDDSISEEDSHCSFLIKVNGVPKLNPLSPSTEIVKSMAAWLSTEKIPQHCDVEILSDYLQQLIQRNEFESFNFVIDNFQRLVSNNTEHIEWKNAYQKVNRIIKDTLKFSR